MENNKLNHDEIFELENLLSINKEKLRESTYLLFDKQIGPINSSFILFGAGSLGRKILNGLRMLGIEPLAFSDNNSELWGRMIDGVKVLAPHEAAKQYGSTAAFIVSIWNPIGERFSVTQNKLKSIGCKKVVSFVPLFYKYPDMFLPYYAIDKPENILNNRVYVEETFRLFKDPLSRTEYLQHIKFRLTGDINELPYKSKEKQYFPSFLVLNPEEVFIDCGAFNGDTIEMFLKHSKNIFKTIWAFEPDPLNFKKLLARISKYDEKIQESIYCREIAVGNKNQKLQFSATGTPGSNLGCGEHEVHCVRIDDILKTRGSIYIKMDIEGAEIEAIDGAKELIKDNAAVIAVSAYHRPDDLWQIPLFIKNICEDYSFIFRTHMEQGWDAVLYAVPNNRLV